MLSRFSRNIPESFRHTLRYFPTFAVPLLSGLLSISIYTRVLGPEGYGYYALVVSACTTTSAIFGEWLVQTIVRFFPEQKDTTNVSRFVKNVGLLLIPSLMVASLLTVPLVMATQSLFLVIVAVVLVNASMLQKMALAFYRAKLDVSRYTAFVVTHTLVSLTLSVVLLYHFRSAPWILVGQTLASVMLLSYVSRKVGSRSRLNSVIAAPASKHLINEMMSYGIPVLVSSVGALVLQVLDRYMLAVMRNMGEVGLYQAVYAFGDRITGLAFGPLLFAIQPLIVREWVQGNRTQSRKHLEDIARFTLLLGIPMVIGSFVLSEPIIRLVNGTQFAEGHVVLPLVLAGTLMWNIGILNHQALEMEKRTAVITKMVGATAVCNVLLNLVLIPLAGYRGAALATVASYGMYALWSRWQSQRITRFYWALPWRSITTAIGASLGSIAVIVFPLRTRMVTSPGWLILGICMVGVLYALALWKLRELKWRS